MNFRYGKLLFALLIYILCYSIGFAQSKKIESLTNQYTRASKAINDSNYTKAEKTLDSAFRYYGRTNVDLIYLRIKLCYNLTRKNFQYSDSTVNLINFFFSKVDKTKFPENKIKEINDLLVAINAYIKLENDEYLKTKNSFNFNSYDAFFKKFAGSPHLKELQPTYDQFLAKINKEKLEVKNDEQFEGNIIGFSLGFINYPFLNFRYGYDFTPGFKIGKFYSGVDYAYGEHINISYGKMFNKKTGLFAGLEWNYCDYGIHGNYYNTDSTNKSEKKFKFRNVSNISQINIPFLIYLNAPLKNKIEIYGHGGFMLNFNLGSSNQKSIKDIYVTDTSVVRSVNIETNNNSYFSLYGDLGLMLRNKTGKNTYQIGFFYQYVPNLLTGTSPLYPYKFTALGLQFTYLSYANKKFSTGKNSKLFY